MSYRVTVKRNPKSEVDLEVSLPSSFLDEARKKVLNELSNSLEISGFRKGHIPENVILQNVGEGQVLEEAADIILREHFPKIVLQEKLDILGSPKISITKLALGNAVEFKASFAVLPEIELPEYKKIAANINEKFKEEKDPEVTEKEIDDVLLQIRKNKAHYDWHKLNPTEKVHAPASGELGRHPDFEKEENLPKLDDELAKSAGNFRDLAELKDKVKQNTLEEKKNRQLEKRRAEILEDLLKKVKIELPEILVESEINKSLAQMKDDITRMQGKWEDYLSHIKKSEEEIRKDLRESSEKKAKIQLILNKIAEAEKIVPDEVILENEVKEILKHYPNAREENARVYVATILQNSAVLKLLESQ